MTDTQIFFSVKMWIFPDPSVLTYVLGAQKNHLIEMVLLSTHNICFCWERRKLIFDCAFYLRAFVRMINCYGSFTWVTNVCVISYHFSMIKNMLWTFIRIVYLIVDPNYNVFYGSFINLPIFVSKILFSVIPLHQ